MLATKEAYDRSIGVRLQDRDHRHIIFIEDTKEIQLALPPDGSFQHLNPPHVGHHEGGRVAPPHLHWHLPGGFTKIAENIKLQAEPYFRGGIIGRKGVFEDELHLQDDIVLFEPLSPVVLLNSPARHSAVKRQWKVARHSTLQNGCNGMPEGDLRHEVVPQVEDLYGRDLTNPRRAHSE